jgi:hypothetical protein
MIYQLKSDLCLHLSAYIDVSLPPDGPGDHDQLPFMTNLLFERVLARK